MTDRPTIFSAPMVSALRAGIKTQTRRLASSPLAKCQPGDRLYVRENFWLYGQWRTAGETKTGRTKWTLDLIGQTVCFEPPGMEAVGYKGRGPGFVWRPAMHHPRWASRLTLVVSDVRLQRLQDISPDDAFAEGAPERSGLPEFHQHDRQAYVDWYRNLWDQLHGAGSWAANPEIVALTFTVHQSNIDSLEAAHG